MIYLLILIAKQILTTLVSMVNMKEELSTRGSILDAWRSCMSLELIEAQVCVDDCTKAQYIQQKLEEQQLE